MKCDYNLKKKNSEIPFVTYFQIGKSHIIIPTMSDKYYILQTSCASPFCLNSKPVRDPAWQDMHMLQHNTD